MTILLAIQEAAPILSLARPNDAVTSTDQTVQRLLAVAHQAGDDIARRGDWSKIIRSADVTNGVLPSDFQRLTTGGSIKRTAPTAYQLRGPLSSEQLRAMPMFGATSVLAYGVQGGGIVYSRALVGGEVIEADYVSKEWLANGAARRRRATQDSDVPLFPYELLTKGIIWRWKQTLGQDVQQEKNEFYADLEFELKQDRGVTT